MNSLNESCLGFNPCDAQNASSKTKQPLSNLQAYVIPPSMANDNVSFSSANAIRACFFLICSRRYSHQREAKRIISIRMNDATEIPHNKGYLSLNGILIIRYLAGILSLLKPICVIVFQSTTYSFRLSTMGISEGLAPCNMRTAVFTSSST